MLSKSFESVKPLRPMFLPQKSRTQNASVRCDTRWSHRPLYQFVLDINLPAAEKLVLLSVASYREPQTHNCVHFGITQPDANDIQQDTGLPASVVTKILRALYDAGYVAVEGMYEKSETYLVEHSLPMFYEYFSLWGILDGTFETEEERRDISARLDNISLEIRESLPFDIRPMERIKHLYPGLYRTHIQKWLQLEKARAIEPAPLP